MLISVKTLSYNSYNI